MVFIYPRKSKLTKANVKAKTKMLKKIQANENLYLENICFFIGDFTNLEIINDIIQEKAKAKDATAIIVK